MKKKGYKLTRLLCVLDRWFGEEIVDSESGPGGLGFTLLREPVDAMDAGIRTSPRRGCNRWDKEGL
jgi:hypothetical protein